MRKTYLSFFMIEWIVQLSHSLDQSPPVVRAEIQSPFIYPIDSNVQLRCPVYSAWDNVFIEWSRTKDFEIDILEDPRHRITLSGTLKIKSATADDSGVYFCKAINGFGSVTANVTLKIVGNQQLQVLNSPIDNLYPRDDNDYLVLDSNINPTFNVRKKPVNKQLVRRVSEHKTIQLQQPIGSSVQLKCNIRTRNVKWFKNGQPMIVPQISYGSKSRRSIVYLYDIGLQDAGNYSCLGESPNGFVNTTYQLNVFDKDTRKPEITALFPTNHTVARGKTATFLCEAASDNSQPHIQWLKEYDRQINSNEAISLGLIQLNNKFYRVVKSSQVIDNVEGFNKLVIENVQTSDSGTYICLVANLLGYTFKEALLRVEEIKPFSNDVRHQTTTSINSIAFWVTISTMSFIVCLLTLLLWMSKKDHECFDLSQEKALFNDQQISECNEIKIPEPGRLRC